MSLNKWISIQVILLYSLSVFPQASLDSLLSRVMQNNQTLAGANQYYENTLISSRTNLYPDNPELEYGYLWSNPQAPGNRTDFSVSQSFEFPGVYTNRSKISRAGVVKASQMVESVRQNTLLEAKQLWIEKVYVNRKLELMKSRRLQAAEVSDYFKKQFENGEISRLKFNKAVLLQASLMAESDLLEAEASTLDNEIARVSGGTAQIIMDREYYLTDYAELDSVLQSSLSDPMYLAHRQEVELLNLQKKLARASAMPRFKTGYYSEKIPGLSMQGVQLGISIPLWENANKVKAASGEIVSAEMALEKYRSDEVSAIFQLHARYKSYRKQTEELARAISVSNDPRLLGLAVESGEISMVEYFFETDLYYRVLFEHLVAEKELYLAEAELRKYEL